MTPPDLLRFADHGGDWAAYEAALYAVFERDILGRPGLRFEGAPVNARRIPEYERRWAAYWHLISEGRVEEDRTPDLRRCERLPWVRWIIESAATHPLIDCWKQDRGSDKSVLLWYDEQYLVILAQRSNYYLLKTAFLVDRSHRVAKFRKERDEYRRRNG